MKACRVEWVVACSSLSECVRFLPLLSLYVCASWQPCNWGYHLLVGEEAEARDEGFLHCWRVVGLFEGKAKSGALPVL